MAGSVEAIYTVAKAGLSMHLVDEVEALCGIGLSGDRYALRTGRYSKSEICEVTLIEAEGLEEIERATGLQVTHGEHRRNIVTRGVKLDLLSGKCFRVGAATFQYDQPRPPCSYLQSITQPGITRALAGKAGICAAVIEAGLIRTNDPIVILE